MVTDEDYYTCGEIIIHPFWPLGETLMKIVHT